MNYIILGLSHQMNLLGNFFYIDENKNDYPLFPEFEIHIITDQSDLPNFDMESSKIVSLFPNKQYFYCQSIKDVYDRFDLPYIFVDNKDIEKYYK